MTSNGRGSLVLLADIHFNEYARFPEMFRHLMSVFRDAVRFAEKQASPLLVLGDTFDPLHGSVAARVLDPVCDLFQEAAATVPIHIIKGNHGRGATGTEDHLETPLGMIAGVTMYDQPEIVDFGHCVVGFVPYTDDKDAFISVVTALNKDLKRLGTSKARILCTHQAYRGGQVGPEEPGFVPGEEQGSWALPATLFQLWTHVFSGHFHNHQTIQLGSTPITYVGAPLQHNFGDEGRTRGFLHIEADRKGLSMEQIAHDEKYPRFLKPNITAKNLKKFQAGDFSSYYVQPVVSDAAVTPEDLKGIKAFQVLPTLWQVYDKGTSRLGEITSQSTAEEILAGYVEARCPNFPEDVKERLLALGLDLYYKAPSKETGAGDRGAITFVRLEVKNFRRVKSAVFDFDEKGVTVFVGRNGSGKSTPRYAIVFALFGSIPGTVESPVNRLVGKGCSVKLTFFCGDKLYTIIRHRKDPVYKDKLLFFRGDSIPEKESKSWKMGASNAQTQRIIDGVVGIDQDIFESIICISRLFKLASADVRDGDKREFLEKAFGLGEWERPYQQTLEDIREQRDSIVEFEKEVTALEAVKERAKLNLADFKLKSDNWDSQRRREIGTLKVELTRTKGQLAQLDEQKVDNPTDLEEKIQELKDKLEELPKDGEPERKKYTQQRLQLTDRIAEAKTKKTVAAQTIETLEQRRRIGLTGLSKISGEGAEERVCPTCRQPVTAEHIEACRRAILKETEAPLEKARHDVNEAQQKWQELVNLRNSLDNRLSRIDANIEARSKIKDSIQTHTQRLLGQKDEFSQHKRQQESLTKQKSQVKKRLADLREQVDPFKELLEKGREELREMVERLNDARTALVNAKARIEDLKFWERGYSKKGVRSYLLDTYLPPLTQTIQEQLDDLSDGVLRMSFASSTVTQSGEASETFTASVTNINGGASYEEQSGGEAHRIDIAIALGVNKHSRLVQRHSVNTLFVDDVMDSFIDDEGATALARLLRGFSHDMWVGLATNKAQIASQFERKVRVTRDAEGFSRYSR